MSGDSEKNPSRVTGRPSQQVVGDLPEDVEGLQAVVHDLRQDNTELRAEIERLRENYRRLQKSHFGPSRDTYIPPANPSQINFFNEAERLWEQSADVEEPELETVVVHRKKRRGKREQDLSVLPHETIDHTLSESERHCPCCDTVMTACGTTDHHELIYVPATLKVVNHRQHAYACPHCKVHGDKDEVVRAPIPQSLLPKSLASPSLVAHIAAEKYDKAVPLYRLERTFADKRFHLPRQNMARWLIQVDHTYLKGYRQALHATMLHSTHLHADETTVHVLKEPGREATQKSCMWVYRTGRGERPIAIYEYQPTKEGRHAVNFLRGFKGTLQTDGSPIYNVLPAADVLRAGCLAHTRRKFVEFASALPKTTPPDKRANVDWIIHRIKRLYKIEETAARDSESLDAARALDHLKQQRDKESRPIFDTLFSRLAALKDEVLPTSAFGRAISYALGQEAYLRVYLGDPLVDIDNNACERAVKPFVLGRKNALFSDTVAGAKASAGYYSILETAKANGLDGYAYLNWLLTELKAQPPGQTIDWNRFFPWSDQVPSHCKLK